jgi:MFS transporter, putative metabolite:H+ symporter
VSAISVGARLDRLPITRLHRKVFNPIGVGMFFEGFDIYIAASVLGATYKTGFSTLEQNGFFISMTFAGMTLGALLTGFLGDRYGRQFTYQLNLLMFGAASLAPAVAPDMTTLIILRFLMGLGLGAEVVVGYSMMAEFFPAEIRGRWSGMCVRSSPRDCRFRPFSLGCWCRLSDGASCTCWAQSGRLLPGFSGANCRNRRDG